jgi:hypothetical protein
MWSKTQLLGQRGGGGLVLGLVSTRAMRHRRAHGATAHSGSGSGGHRDSRHCSRSSPHSRRQRRRGRVQVSHVLLIE